MTPIRMPAAGSSEVQCVVPARMASIARQQSTVRASGPTESRLKESGVTPAIGTRLAVGL